MRWAATAQEGGGQQSQFSYRSIPAADALLSVAGLFYFPKILRERSALAVDDSGQGTFVFHRNEKEAVKMSLELAYFYGSEAEQYSFYRVMSQ